MPLWLIALFVVEGASSESSRTPRTPQPSPSPAFLAAPAPASSDPGAGPWEVVKPAVVGLRSEDLDEANMFIRKNVLDRQCFLLIKEGKIVYEWYDAAAPDPPLTPPWNGSAADKPHHGYSMTKTIGGFLILLAATEDNLDIDADITEKYNVSSPKPYGVTLRMMMAQVLGGNQRPGEMWEYDELGTMWLHLMPKVILAATGHPASYYMNRLHARLGLSKQFTWPQVDQHWFRGASGSCRDWARFGQLILNGGEWGGEPLIAPRWIKEMQEPVKYAPYESYSNPCYGLLIWTNANKTKHPGCCWEASRLPEPKCNDDTFMPGAVTDLTLNIGLYGQLVMTLPSVNTVVVGFGRDLRPIEPTRIGYYPGVCRALGIPCNTPPPVPPTKCGELLQCTGVSAQCFSGGSWSHAEPEPGKDQCVRCFQGRLPYYEGQFPEANYMVKNWCPNTTKAAMEYIACFCGLTGVNANPWAPWPSTTTTTPPPSPAPPLPPPHPTPAPPNPGPPCGLTPRCIQGLTARYDCWDMAQNGGHDCYRGIDLHQQVLTSTYGCPNFMDYSAPILQSKAFCWCGLDPSWPSGPGASLHLLPPPRPHLDDVSLHFPPHNLGHLDALTVRSETRATPFLGKADGGGLCHNQADNDKIKRLPQSFIEADLMACATAQFGDKKQSGTVCMMFRLGFISFPCAACFGGVINCGHQHCFEQCACGRTDACHRCVTGWCKPMFNICSGNKDDLSTNLTLGGAEEGTDLPRRTDDEYTQVV